MSAEDTEFEIDAQQEAIAQQQARDDEIYRHTLLQRIDFALQVRQFLDSKIGERILSDSEAELAKLTNAIFDLDPDDPEERKVLRQVRLRAGILRHWQECFAEYITAGKNAETELQESA
jgi:hypothetical protein